MPIKMAILAFMFLSFLCIVVRLFVICILGDFQCQRVSRAALVFTQSSPLGFTFLFQTGKRTCPLPG